MNLAGFDRLKVCKKKIVCLYSRNSPVSYSQFWTGTSLQLRLMRGVFSNANDLIINDIPPHEPPLQASSSLIPRIRNWSINMLNAILPNMCKEVGINQKMAHFLRIACATKAGVKRHTF